jgi:hypothetical protein
MCALPALYGRYTAKSGRAITCMEEMRKAQKATNKRSERIGEFPLPHAQLYGCV